MFPFFNDRVLSSSLARDPTVRKVGHSNIFILQAHDDGVDKVDDVVPTKLSSGILGKSELKEKIRPLNFCQ